MVVALVVNAVVLGGDCGGEPTWKGGVFLPFFTFSKIFCFVEYVWVVWG